MAVSNTGVSPRPRLHASTRRRPGAVIARWASALAGVLLSACAGIHPLEPGRLENAPLAEIHQAFERGVAQIKANPNDRWRSGWMGNIWVNLSDDGSQGLCYQWQQVVYRTVLPTVKKMGWHATGIMINFGTINEHHAVLVFDPGKVRQDQLLSAPAGKPAYVLDAWRRGRADIYRLDDWLQLPMTVRVPPKLTAVPGD